MSQVILVTGATGNQGGAVLEALVKQNDGRFTIIALTRNATSPAAKRISASSSTVHVMQGNLDNPDLMFLEAQTLIGKPVWGVFMVQSVIAGGVTAAQEEAQGKKVIDASIAHGVEMFVYTSVDRGGEARSPLDPTPCSVFASKHRIEQHLFAASAPSATKPETADDVGDETGKRQSMSWFVLRPTGLFEPLLRNDFFGKLGRTSWKVYAGTEPQVEKRWQWVSCKDVGHFAAQGFLYPDQWTGKCLSLAGWEGTFSEANGIHEEITGRGFRLTFNLLARFICGVVVKDISISYKWCNEKGFGAEIERLRRLHPGMLSLEDYLKGEAEKTG